MSSYLPLLIILATAPTPKPAQPLAERKPAVPELSRREGKTWQVTVGLDAFPYLGPSVQTAYFLDPDRLLTLSLRGGSDILTTLFTGGSFSDSIEASTYAAGYKRFVDRSLYYEVSLYYQVLKRWSYYHEGEEDSAQQAEMSTDQLGVMGTIGYQWQKSRFTLGFDLAGLALPLAVGDVKTKRKGNEVSEETLTADQEDFKEKGAAGFFLALRFYLGFSF